MIYKDKYVNIKLVSKFFNLLINYNTMHHLTYLIISHMISTKNC